MQAILLRVQAEVVAAEWWGVAWVMDQRREGVAVGEEPSPVFAYCNPKQQSKQTSPEK